MDLLWLQVLEQVALQEQRWWYWEKNCVWFLTSCCQINRRQPSKKSLLAVDLTTKHTSRKAGVASQHKLNHWNQTMHQVLFMLSFCNIECISLEILYYAHRFIEIIHFSTIIAWIDFWINENSWEITIIINVYTVSDLPSVPEWLYSKPLPYGVLRKHYYAWLLSIWPIKPTSKMTLLAITISKLYKNCSCSHGFQYLNGGHW